ncbi:2Fe-2S ferredoxin [Capsicum baccatum]|uniref:2Fe-2S ferredoxin n=1 Tax=Capsicum baccatum TaxID=33114 RepID=A0A2G2XND9_CAPBA|nr:2Fe-2S ferredoxin [Capsicum baccatum]
MLGRKILTRDDLTIPTQHPIPFPDQHKVNLGPGHRASKGACEASLACSTCHVIVMVSNYYNKLEDPTDDENDMLDLAFGLTNTSRLGCQVIAKPELDGIRLALPVAMRNFAVDGYQPKPH